MLRENIWEESASIFFVLTCPKTNNNIESVYLLRQPFLEDEKINSALTNNYFSQNIMQMFTTDSITRGGTFWNSCSSGGEMFFRPPDRLEVPAFLKRNTHIQISFVISNEFSSLLTICSLDNNVMAIFVFVNNIFSTDIIPGLEILVWNTWWMIYSRNIMSLEISQTLILR